MFLGLDDTSSISGRWDNFDFHSQFDEIYSDVGIDLNGCNSCSGGLFVDPNVGPDELWLVFGHQSWEYLVLSCGIPLEPNYELDHLLLFMPRESMDGLIGYFTVFQRLAPSDADMDLDVDITDFNTLSTNFDPMDIMGAAYSSPSWYAVCIWISTRVSCALHGSG